MPTGSLCEIYCEISFGYGVHGNLPSRLQEIVKGLNQAFAYLEARLTGACRHVHSCVRSYEICGLLQLFDPSFIEVIVPFGARPVLMPELQRNLHLYVAASARFMIDHGDVGDFSASILTW